MSGFNPFEKLTDADADLLRRLYDEPDLGFIGAVELAGLDPANDFQFANLSGISFDGLDLSAFDFLGANIKGCSFEGTILPQNLPRIVGYRNVQSAIARPPGTVAYLSTSWSPELNTVTFSPNGRYLAIASKGRGLRVWDVAAGQVVATSRQVYGGLLKADFSPDNRNIVAVDRGGNVAIHDVETGGFTDDLGERYTGKSTDAVFSPDGARIVTGQEDGQVRVWELHSKRLLTTFESHRESIRTICYCPRGAILLTASADGAAYVWKENSGEVVTTLFGHEAGINGAAYSGDGRRIATILEHHKVRMWDAKTGLCISTFENNRLHVSRVKFLSDGRCLALVSSEDLIQLWDVEAKKPIWGNDELDFNANHVRDWDIHNYKIVIGLEYGDVLFFSMY